MAPQLRLAPHHPHLLPPGRYITVNEKAGRSLFYIFVESKNSAADPVVLWLNG